MPDVFLYCYSRPTQGPIQCWNTLGAGTFCLELNRLGREANLFPTHHHGVVLGHAQG